jgi:hypothetical protein
MLAELAGTFAPMSPIVTTRLRLTLPFKALFMGTFQLSPRAKPCPVGIRARPQGENLRFSTFFSTVVDNFGGRPYGRRREGPLTPPLNGHKRRHRAPAHIDTGRTGSLLSTFLRQYSSVAGDPKS